jgi:hypothetical protein
MTGKGKKIADEKSSATGHEALKPMQTWAKNLPSDTGESIAGTVSTRSSAG